MTPQVESFFYSSYNRSDVRATCSGFNWWDVHTFRATVSLCLNVIPLLYDVLWWTTKRREWKEWKKLLVSIIRYKHNNFYSRSGVIDSCPICVSMFRHSRPYVWKKWLLFPIPMLITQPSKPLQYWTQIDTINHTIDLSMLKNNWIIHLISLAVTLPLSPSILHWINGSWKCLITRHSSALEAKRN